jgi:hypothetical protein
MPSVEGGKTTWKIRNVSYPPCLNLLHANGYRHLSPPTAGRSLSFLHPACLVARCRSLGAGATRSVRRADWGAPGRSWWGRRPRGENKAVGLQILVVTAPLGPKAWPNTAGLCPVCGAGNQGIGPEPHAQLQVVRFLRSFVKRLRGSGAPWGCAARGASRLRHYHHVLDPNPTQPGHVDARFHGDHCALREDIFRPLAERGALVSDVSLSAHPRCPYPCKFGTHDRPPVQWKALTNLHR